jgi:hypothetical protein
MKPAEERIKVSTGAHVVALVLFVGLAGYAPIATAQSPGAFTATANMDRARVGHTATLLANGRILVAGGEDNVRRTTECGDPEILAGAELFDPSTGIFTVTGVMARSRIGHTATLLANGTVLVAGGDKENFSVFTDCEGTLYCPLPSAELFDPSTGRFRATKSMTRVRTGHTATLLPDGTVLIAGGATDGHAGTQSFCPAMDFRYGGLANRTDSAEIYDPATGGFLAVSNMTIARYRHTATLLDDGKVLIAGGAVNGTASAEIYNPSTRTFTATGDMSTDRYGQSATSLPNGKVLVAGGWNNAGIVLGSAELYAPSTGTFAAIGSMTQSRGGHSATPLRDGTILIAGGAANGAASAESYDPAAGSFTAVGTTNSFRSFHTASALANGVVLITGGYAGSNTTGRTEFYDPQSIRTAKTTQKPPQDFDSDGKTDTLWRDAAGNVSMWLMDGFTIRRDSFIANIWMGWTIVGTGDFNGDGKADIVWRESGGDVAIWLMDGSSISSYSLLGNMHVSWKIDGVADFNGDGKADILWRNTAGNVLMWLMQGHTITSSSAIASIWTGWTIIGSGDFNGDGKADILWRDTAGNAAVWLMDGTAISKYSDLEVMPALWNDSTWKVFGVADFDGDGKADILWRNSAGSVAILLMNGTTIASNWHIANIWTGWTIAGTGDFSGDGKADILWRDATGTVAIWSMDGITLSDWHAMENVSDRMAH